MVNRSDCTTPQARSEDLLTRELADGETVVYDRRTNDAHNLNRVATAVWERCDGKTRITDIARDIQRSLDTPCTEEVVQLALQELHRIDLVDRTLPTRISRREVIRKVGPGIAAAALVPAVLSIVAPTPAAALSCIPKDGACTSGAQCCSGFCRPSGVCA